MLSKPRRARSLSGSPSLHRAERRSAPRASYGKRFLFATALIAALVASQQPASAVGICHTIRGSVVDPHDAKIAGARVQLEDHACSAESAPSFDTTDIDGAFELRVEGDVTGASAIASASSEFHAPTSKLIRTATLLTSRSLSPSPSSSSNKFVLAFKLTVTMTRNAIRPGATELVTAVTSAPPPSAGAPTASHVVLEALANGPQVMQLAATTGRWSRWEAPITASSDATDAASVVIVCATDARFTGTCDEAKVALNSPEGHRQLVSEIVRLPVLIDGTAPVLVSSNPAPYGTYVDVGTAAANWVDVGSGVDPASRVILVDGAPPETVIQDGVHLFTATAVDRAGNAATVSHLFTKAFRTASAATATLRQTAIPVNPTGSLPPPTRVRFSKPAYDTSAFTETISASTRVGIGSAKRPVAFGAVQVVFRNESGLEMTVIGATAPSNAAHDTAIVSPTVGPATSEVPASSGALSDIVVDVPAGFATSESSATLLAKTTPLGTLVPSPGEVFDTAWPSRFVVSGTLGVCFVRAGPAEGRCRVHPAAGAEVVIADKTHRPYIPVEAKYDAEFSSAPSCTGCVVDEPLNAAHTYGCPTVLISGVRYNLCTGTDVPADDGAYVAQTAFRVVVPDSPTEVIWQQARLRTGATACPGGGAGSRLASIYRAVVNSQGVSGGVGPTVAPVDTAYTWDDANNRLGTDQVALLGAKSGNSRLWVPGDADYQMSNEGFSTAPTEMTGAYLEPARSVRTSSGGIWAGELGASGGWQAGGEPIASGRGLTGELRLIGGASFVQPPDAGAADLYGEVNYQLVMEASCG